MNLKKDLLIYAAIGVVAFCAFANTLGHGFVYDDNRQILRNPLIQRPELYGKALTSDVWAFKGGGNIAASNYFRPTFVAWMILNWRLFGASPFGWHLAIVLLHVGVCLLLFAFLLRLGSDKNTAAVITLLFAVHPVHVENVAWISGATDPLLSVFLLTSLILAQAYADSRRARSSAILLLAFSVITFFLAMGAKEIGLLCVPLYWLIFRNADGGSKISSFDAARLTIPFVVAAFGFFFARFAVLGALTLPVEDPVQSNYAFLTIPKVFAVYLRQLVLPLWLGPALPVRPVENFGLMDFVLPLIISLSAIWILWKVALRSKIQSFGLALFALLLVPVLNPMNFGTEQLAHDRYLYLPLAGLLMVIVPAITNFLADRELLPSNRKPLIVAFVLVTLVLASKTFLYNRVWTDGETLWRYAATIDPGAAHVWNNIGAATQNPCESLDAFERSLKIKPNIVGHVGKARSLIALGRFEEAIPPARQAIEADPAEVTAFSLFQAYEAETLALARLGRYSEAEASLRTARQRLPIYHASLTEKLAIVLYTQNRKPEALAELESVSDRARREYLIDSKAVFLRLGMLYSELGRKAEARAALQEYLATTVDAQDAAFVADRRGAAELLRQLGSAQ